MKEDFLRDFLELPHGVPCHDAYSRLFRVMKPTSFQAFYDKFRADFTAGCGEGPAIAIDGKEMRRSFDKSLTQKFMFEQNALLSALSRDEYRQPRAIAFGFLLPH